MIHHSEALSFVNDEIFLPSLLVVLVMNLPSCVPRTYRFGKIKTQDLSLSTAPRSPKRE